MTLGERIQQLRKEKHLSQEELGAALGVSRQAVSKWETGQTLPDTANLLAMAELFGVSADELAGRKREVLSPSSEGDGKPSPTGVPGSGAPGMAPKPFSRRTLFKGLAVATACLIAALALNPSLDGGSPAASAPAVSAPASFALPEELSEFSLLWSDNGVRGSLSLGIQDSLFPFGTSLRLTEQDKSYTGDDSRVVYHEADCGALHLTYAHITDPASSPSEWESLEKVTTITGVGGRTPRGIGVGSPKEDLLAAYGDKLVYCLKESGSGILVRHDYFYAWQDWAHGGGNSLVFYLQDGRVAGIKLEDMEDLGTDAYAPNNVTRFPMKDGAPDFSQRMEPDTEAVDETRAVYIAFQTLSTDENLSAQEAYDCRRTIFENLRHLDWQEYGRLGEAGKETETQQTLLDWLRARRDFSQDELLELQLGRQSNLDGWLSEDYSSALANAFFRYPVSFARLLADNENSAENARNVALLTAYGTDLDPEQETAAVGQLRRFGLTGREGAWAEYLAACMEAPLEGAAQISPPEAS